MKNSRAVYVTRNQICIRLKVSAKMSCTLIKGLKVKDWLHDRYPRYDLRDVSAAYKAIMDMPVTPPNGHYSLTGIALKNHISSKNLFANSKRRGFPKPVGQYRSPSAHKITNFYKESEVLAYIGISEYQDEKQDEIITIDDMDKWPTPTSPKLKYRDNARLLHNIFAGAI